MMGLTLGKAILYSSSLVAAFISHIHIFIGHRYTLGPIYGSRYSKPGFLHHCQDTSDSADVNVYLYNHHLIHFTTHSADIILQ